MNSIKKQEFTRRISQANSTQMVVILYDMAIEYIENAKEALRISDIDNYHLFIGRIQGCLSELCNSLHYEYAIARNLRQLYSFCIRRVGDSEVKLSELPLDEVLRVIVPLRNAYEKVVPYNTNGPVMDNSETVYAGLTYGKNDINENLVSQNNRGYLV